MKPTVYIETSVVSALVETRDDPVSQSQKIITRDWWETQRRYYDLFSSQFLIPELEGAEFPGQKEALELARRLTLFPATPEVEGLPLVYRKQLVMP